MDSTINVPARPPLSGAGAICLAAQSALLSPFYLLAAWLKGGPGLSVHWSCAETGLKLLVRKPRKHHARWIYYPLDSTRYFEIPFALRHAGQFEKWLDVSSPRQLAALLLPRHPRASAVLLNPDAVDLAETREMAGLLGLTCETAGARIDEFESNSKFDLITCLSVLEHIPDDAGALKKMWQMLSPGGRFILTVPASAEGGTQRISQDPYGLHQATEGDGYFFQRFYSPRQIRDLESITGAPLAREVWGERQNGWLQASFERKRLNPAYPVWREPYDMAANWRQFDTIEALPGEGVWCAVYAKPPA
jgi:SAM-dependent methyltransferase